MLRDALFEFVLSERKCSIVDFAREPDSALLDRVPKKGAVPDRVRPIGA